LEEKEGELKLEILEADFFKLRFRANDGGRDEGIEFILNHHKLALRMSKRLNKRQQRLEDEFKQQEEHAAAAAINKLDVDEEEEEDEKERPSTRSGGAFAAVSRSKASFL